MTTTHLVNIFPPPHLHLHLHKPRSLSKLFSSSTSSSFPQIPTLSLSNPTDFPYGPSLFKGKPVITTTPHQSQDPVINKESFIRIYDISAIRVPAAECFRLESRIRGHLLNWPRVRNIARVDGDEVEEEFKDILPVEKRVEAEGTLERRLHGRFGHSENANENVIEVLYRDKLTSSFNAKGYMKFRNLARLSRPKKRKSLRRYEGSGVGVEGRNDFVAVEVVEEVDEDDMSGLLGDKFKGGRGGKWRGSTRLLLLDERYGSSSVEELPQAVKVYV